MDLHSQSLGRSMILARGGIAFVIGAVAANQPEKVVATTLVVVWGIWALADGAATLRQAFPPSGTASRAEAQPLLLVLGGVGVVVGALAVVVPGLSPGVLTWLLAAWFAVRVASEGLGALVARTKIRVLLGSAAVVDAGLVALLLTHTSGSVANVALFGGGLALVWALLYLSLGLMTAKVLDWAPEGPRLLSRR